MSEYTPTETGVRLAYIGGLSESGFSREEHRAEFDRFIEQIRAVAWEEGARAIAGVLDLSPEGTITYVAPDNPYRKADDE